MSSTPLNAPVASALSHPLQEFWRYFKGNKGALAGLAIVVAVLLMALFAPWLAPYPPDLTNNTCLLYTSPSPRD